MHVIVFDLRLWMSVAAHTSRYRSSAFRTAAARRLMAAVSGTSMWYSTPFQSGMEASLFIAARLSAHTMFLFQWNKSYQTLSRMPHAACASSYSTAFLSFHSALSSSMVPL